MHGHYSARFEQALTFAYRLHATQVRKGSRVPYVSHLMAVAGLVLEHGGTQDEAIAGLLHDAVEDQGGDPVRHEIEKMFGASVLDIVNGCTDADVKPKPPWKARKERYVAHVREAPHSVRLVSASDKLHNARTMLADLRIDGARLWDRFSASRDETLWYYHALVDAFRVECDEPDAHRRQRFAHLVDELEKVVRELDALSR